MQKARRGRTARSMTHMAGPWSVDKLAAVAGESERRSPRENHFGTTDFTASALDRDLIGGRYGVRAAGSHLDAHAGSTPRLRERDQSLAAALHEKSAAASADKQLGFVKSLSANNLGTIFGTTRYARWCTICAFVNVLHAHIALHTYGDQGKRVTAIHGGQMVILIESNTFRP